MSSRTRTFARMILAAAMLASAPAAYAQPNQLTVGVSAPLSGPSAILGEQVRNGALTSASSLGVTIDAKDDQCTAEGGAAAARAFVEARVVAVVGYLCTEALEAALPILKDAGIPAITVGVRTDSITDRRGKTGWPIFRLAARGDGEATAIAAILPKLWRETAFAIVDDGTIRARDVAETLRLAADETQLKPVLIDVYRPDQDSQKALVEKLSKAGAKRVFVSGSAADVAVIGRDAAAAKLDAILAGGEALADQPPAGLPTGTLMIGLQDWRERAEPGALSNLADKGVMPDGYVLPAYAAVQIVTEAAKSPSPLDRLGGDAFPTAIGAIRFDAKGDLAPSPYRLFAYDGQRFAPMESE